MSKPALEPDSDPRHTPFLSLVRYVLGFMGLIALTAFTAVWLLRHC